MYWQLRRQRNYGKITDRKPTVILHEMTVKLRTHNVVLYMHTA